MDFVFFHHFFLGNRACIKTELEETNEQFKVWGISHFLARSGLHLALFHFYLADYFLFYSSTTHHKTTYYHPTQLYLFYLNLDICTIHPFICIVYIINKLCLFTKTSFPFIALCNTRLLCVFYSTARSISFFSIFNSALHLPLP